MESSKHCLQVYAFISNLYINSPPDFLHVLVISGHITSSLFFSQDDYFYFLIDGHSCNCSLFSLHFHSTLYPTFLSLIAFHTFWLAQEKGLYGKSVQKRIFSDDSILNLTLPLNTDYHWLHEVFPMVSFI